MSPILTIDWFNWSMVLFDDCTASTTRVVAAMLSLISILLRLTCACESRAAAAVSFTLLATSCTDWLNSSVAGESRAEIKKQNDFLINIAGGRLLGAFKSRKIGIKTQFHPFVEGCDRLLQNPVGATC